MPLGKELYPLIGNEKLEQVLNIPAAYSLSPPPPSTGIVFTHGLNNQPIMGNRTCMTHFHSFPDTRSHLHVFPRNDVDVLHDFPWKIKSTGIAIALEVQEKEL